MVLPHEYADGQRLRDLCASGDSGGAGLKLLLGVRAYVDGGGQLLQGL
jgi:hypothetical protein